MQKRPPNRPVPTGRVETQNPGGATPPKSRGNGIPDERNPKSRGNGIPEERNPKSRADQLHPTATLLFSAVPIRPGPALRKKQNPGGQVHPTARSPFLSRRRVKRIPSAREPLVTPIPLLGFAQSPPPCPKSQGLARPARKPKPRGPGSPTAAPRSLRLYHPVPVAPREKTKSRRPGSPHSKKSNPFQATGQTNSFCTRAVSHFPFLFWNPRQPPVCPKSLTPSPLSAYPGSKS